jgi:hypothetical protein
MAHPSANMWSSILDSTIAKYRLAWQMYWVGTARLRMRNQEVGSDIRILTGKRKIDSSIDNKLA